MNEVTDIGSKHTPLVISQKVPWDKVKKCIVIYEDPDDGNIVIHVSEKMQWKDRTWLSGELQNYNAAVSAVQYMQYCKDHHP